MHAKQVHLNRISNKERNPLVVIKEKLEKGESRRKHKGETDIFVDPNCHC